MSPDDLAQIEHEARKLHAAGLVLTPEQDAARKARPVHRNRLEPAWPATPAWLPPKDDDQ